MTVAEVNQGGRAPASEAGREGDVGYVLHPEDRAAIECEMRHYEDSRATSIAALKLIQKRHGWVPDGAIPEIARLLGIAPSDLEGVATFYSLIFRRPVGRHVIKICDSVACFLTGAAQVQEAFARELRIGLGDTTGDRRFTLLPICCLGACDKGPALMIDEALLPNVAPEDVRTLLERYP